jgi:lactoylglutathione lyase
MLPIRGIYEVAIKVKDLSVAERFYREVLGLTVGLREERRKWLFLRGGDGMVVLQEDRGEWPKQHFAFAVDQSDIEAAAAAMRERGMKVTGPVFHEWIPAKSVYFVDPDRHDLELCAALSVETRR